MRLAMRLPEKKPGDSGVANDIDPREGSDAEVIDRAQRNGFPVVARPAGKSDALGLVAVIAIVAGLGLMILVGYTGLVSLGHAAFLAIGAYTHAYILVSYMIDIKHYERYALASNGNAATLYGYASSGDQTGTYCWTREVTTTYNNDYSKTLQGRTIPAQQSGTSATSTMYCDSSAPTDSTTNYKYATEIIAKRENINNNLVVILRVRNNHTRNQSAHCQS